MKQIIAFVRDVPKEEVSSVRKMCREDISSIYFHSIFNLLREKGFHGGEIVFLNYDGSPVEASRIRINIQDALIDEKFTQWNSGD
ncbi:MAG: hypothetical protein ACOC5T_04125 [Elusimicrobiota bacterium]